MEFVDAVKYLKKGLIQYGAELGGWVFVVTNEGVNEAREEMG